MNNQYFNLNSVCNNNDNNNNNDNFILFNTGRQYDGFGRLRDWFDPMTASMFNTTTRCMKTQYSDYSVCGMAVNIELNITFVPLL